MAYPVLAVTIDGKDHQLQTRQGDICRVEEDTRTSWSRLVGDLQVMTIARLGYHAARRSGVIGPDVTMDWWLDNATTRFDDDVESAEGKVSDPVPPTG